MRNLKDLLFHRSHDITWQDTVIEKLDSLAEAQDQLRKELADHVGEGRPTPLGRLRAISFLVATAALIIFSVSATIISSTFKDRATTALSQAQMAREQVINDLQPVENIVAKHGAKYLLAHANKSLLSDVQAAEKPALQMSKFNAKVNHFDFEWIVSEYAGQIVLAISSAGFGAAAGWLLIPALSGKRSRRRNHPKPSPPSPAP